MRPGQAVDLLRRAVKAVVGDLHDVALQLFRRLQKHFAGDGSGVARKQHARSLAAQHQHGGIVVEVRDLFLCVGVGVEHFEIRFADNDVLPAPERMDGDALLSFRRRCVEFAEGGFVAAFPVSRDARKMLLKSGCTADWLAMMVSVIGSVTTGKPSLVTMPASARAAQLNAMRSASSKLRYFFMDTPPNHYIGNVYFLHTLHNGLIL